MKLTPRKKPPIPPEGIPPQKTPAWIRLFFRLLVYPFLIIDLAMQGAIHRIIPPPYKVKGACLKRGICCHYIFIKWDPLMDKWGWLGKFWLWWYVEINGFYFRGFEVEDGDSNAAKVMGCRHLSEEGTCNSYFWRPGICRQWPRIEYVRKPHLLKGCGYSILLDEEEESRSSSLPPQS